MQVKSSKISFQTNSTPIQVKFPKKFKKIALDQTILLNFPTKFADPLMIFIHGDFISAFPNFKQANG